MSFLGGLNSITRQNPLNVLFLFLDVSKLLFSWLLDSSSKINFINYDLAEINFYNLDFFA